MPDEPHPPLICDRCSRLLTPGAGNFYVVHIEALADPTPPSLDDSDEALDVGAEIDRLIDEMEGMSEQELMDQIHRRLTLHLCGPCYRHWIENPTGG